MTSRTPSCTGAGAAWPGCRRDAPRAAGHLAAEAAPRSPGPPRAGPGAARSPSSLPLALRAEQPADAAHQGGGVQPRHRAVAAPRDRRRRRPAPPPASRPRAPRRPVLRSCALEPWPPPAPRPGCPPRARGARRCRRGEQVRPAPAPGRDAGDAGGRLRVIRRRGDAARSATSRASASSSRAATSSGISSRPDARRRASASPAPRPRRSAPRAPHPSWLVTSSSGRAAPLVDSTWGPPRGFPSSPRSSGSSRARPREHRLLTVPGAHVEDLGGLLDRVALHVDQHQRGALLGAAGSRGRPARRRGARPPRPPPPGRRRPRAGTRRPRPWTGRASVRVRVVGQRVGGADLAAAEPVQAGVDDDPVQPGGDRGVAAVGPGAAEGGDHRVLQGVGGVLGVAGGAQRDRPQPVPVPPEQRAERVVVTGDVRREQGPVVRRIARPPGAHDRTLTSAICPL